MSQVCKVCGVCGGTHACNPTDINMNEMRKTIESQTATIKSLRAQLVKPLPTPSQSEPVEWNFEYDQLTEEFIHELDDKTVMSISGFNRGYWAQYFNSKPQPTSQDAIKLLKEARKSINEGLETDGELEAEWSVLDKDLIARIDAAMKESK